MPLRLAASNTWKIVVKPSPGCLAYSESSFMLAIIFHTNKELSLECGLFQNLGKMNFDGKYYNFIFNSL